MPWTGCWTSLNATYDFQGLGEIQGNGPTAGLGRYLDGAGVDIGLGCNWQAANMVFGLMGDIGLANLGSVGNVENADWRWFVGSRAGVLVGPSTLAYGLIGYTSLEGFSVDLANFSTDMRGLTLVSASRPSCPGSGR